ncbi:ubiquitin carboxyl-terminal hydrolase 14-like isoform X1 [Chenopodium quinoa]|uniref:ubiquitin carboxyl-terminal hydrolase 14-like isoform X1 n=1 Tax=Chenopodium quinoa TaxID=63459 RepID=UPI000B771912|nr:ubiquitin carboxyl-terminal hydrolase 14-like isoform X1 [Chenopodium quinoa]
MVEAMDILRANLSRVRIPEPTNRIFKHECCVSFDTPKSEGGLYVDMSSFLAFGKDFVQWNYEKTRNPVYLHIKQTKKVVAEDRPSKKPTILAIGVEGGFGSGEPDYEESYSIVILPDYASLPFPSVELPEKVRLAVDAILLAEDAERKEQVAAWVAEKQVSAYALGLPQIDNGIVVPPSGWKCAKCDKTDNLWLNLTDGTILCGRKNWDGTGGNNHAVEHYNETKYPLAVKLGTITADLEAADVFSYAEDESVIDPLLSQHLAHFGIDFSSLQKTEMTTAERELDQNTNFDWNRIQESAEALQPIFGPGYTGLVNLGNSCYLAATMQVAYTAHAFMSRYYANQSLKSAFDAAPADPTVDLNMQLAKLGHGLLSGRYSIPSSEKQEGIPPRMFKTVIAASHPEFSTTRQQDALEFFLHLLEQVERVNAGNPKLDPSRNFKFGIEDRIQCPSGKVTYNRRSDYILSLNIPLHEATNKDQLEAFQKLKSQAESEGKEMAAGEVVRPRVPLEACLASYSAPEEVMDFFSTALKAKTTATKTTGLTSFPDYLVLHMRKFVMEDGWVPKKLDVYIDVPDIIDISHMRSNGLRPGEELLPESAGDAEAESTRLVADELIVSQLLSMGFGRLPCEKASIFTNNAGVEEAMNWLLTHMDDSDINDPISHTSQNAAVYVDPSSVEVLISFGFQEELARKALTAMGGDIEKATDWIFNNPDASSTSDMDTSSSGAAAADAELPDGSGRYRLLGFVSHMGTSTHCGHYVAHIYKDGKWVLYNDEKVGASVNPPKDMGYLYFFERLAD